jgi:hypothetical protein
LPASSNSFLQTLSNWRILFAALAVILIGASDTARHLWTTFLRNIERMVGIWYQFRLKCTAHRAKFKAQALSTNEIDLRLLFAYPCSMGEMRRAIAREKEEQMRDRFSSTLVIAASIIAAVRLAREDISTPSPRLLSTVGDSVLLARMILKRVVGA